MRTIAPLLDEGASRDEHKRLVARTLRQALAERSITLNRLRLVHHVNKTKAFTGRCDFGRRSIFEVLDAGGIRGQDRRRILQVYLGRDPRYCCRDHLQAHLRLREDLASLSTRIQCNQSTLLTLLLGHIRTRGRKKHLRKPPTFPIFPLWSKIASAIDLPDEAAYDMWLRDAREHFATPGRNSLSVELHVVLHERGLSVHQLRCDDELRAACGLRFNAFQRCLNALKAGRILPWPQLRAIFSRIGTDDARQNMLLSLVARTLLEEHPSIQALRLLPNGEQRIAPQAISAVVHSYTATGGVQLARQTIARMKAEELVSHAPSSVESTAVTIVADEMRTFFGRSVPSHVHHLRSLLLDCATVRLRRYGSGDLGVWKTREELRRIIGMRMTLDRINV